MTAVYSFYGSSDDLIEVDGPEGADEFSEPGGVWRGTPTALDGERVQIIARYGDNTAGDCWSFAVAQASEGDRLPAWRYSFLPAPDCSYSVRLVVGPRCRMTDHYDLRT